MKIFTISLLFLIALPAMAQEAKDIRVRDEFHDAQNYENERRLLRLENQTVNLATGVTGTLGTANGGTGSDLSQTADYSVFYAENGVFVALGPGDDGEVLTTNGTASAPEWDNRSGFEKFTVDGSFTVPADTTSVYLTGCGGGGGGGGGGNVGNPEGGGGGGAGQCAFRHPWQVAPLTVMAVTIGDLGPGGAGNSNGTDGGATVFGTFSLEGGNAGETSIDNSGTGGAAIALPSHSYDGDHGVGSTPGVSGTYGMDGNFMILTGAGGTSPIGVSVGSGGGATPFGDGGDGGAASTAGEDACTTCYGAGGGGGGSVSAEGGDGAQGILYVEY